ncbi:MAG: hypothetical protein KGI05_01920 [Thaumarchaeota archaeon]|nr:hypothetical protein [Nitrososphaerota archaeon]
MRIILLKRGEHLSSELSLDEMWEKIEEYGIDRKLLEATHPSNELLFQLYTAVLRVNERVHALNNDDAKTQ